MRWHYSRRDRKGAEHPGRSGSHFLMRASCFNTLILNAFGTGHIRIPVNQLKKGNKKPPRAGSGKEGGTLPPPGGFNGAIHALYITHEKWLCKGPGKINFSLISGATDNGFF
jgi:hypothetical protein